MTLRKFVSPNDELLLSSPKLDELLDVDVLDRDSEDSDDTLPELDESLVLDSLVVLVVDVDVSVFELEDEDEDESILPANVTRIVMSFAVTFVRFRISNV